MIAQFIGLYPAVIDLNVTADLTLRRLFCDFLCGSLLIVLARCEDNIEHQVPNQTKILVLVEYLAKLTVVSSNTIPICER